MPGIALYKLYSRRIRVVINMKLCKTVYRTLYTITKYCKFAARFWYYPLPGHANHCYNFNTARRRLGFGFQTFDNEAGRKGTPDSPSRYVSRQVDTYRSVVVPSA